MKKSKLIKISIIFIIILISLLIKTNVCIAGTLSSDINGIDENKYPGVKSLIQKLQNSHSNYNFQVYYTGIDWTEAVTMEYQGHGHSPQNLFSVAEKYKGKWYCPICGYTQTQYDTGWYCASIDAIKYMMDPRNSLDETSLFQFKNLEASDVTASNIQTVISNKYSSYSYINNSNVINAIVNASSQNGLNGYSILAKIINEQGKGTSVLVTGAGYNGYGIGYYNFFNVGAYGNGTSTVITNGLKYAISESWNSPESSILGGSKYYKSKYIDKGQNTLYYQKFNVVNTTSLFSHQYQQDVLGAETSGRLLREYYEITGTKNSVSHTFIIPLYENMPKTACSRPDPSENSSINCEDASVLTNNLAVKAGPNGKYTVSYLNAGEKIKVIERATSKSSDGNYWDIIVSNTDGTYGYVVRSGISSTNNFPTYVFDYKYYADTNSDLKAAFGYNETNLYNHFVNYGAKEGRSSSAVFNVKYYLENNSDLSTAFGTDYISACTHFANLGCNEYRKSAENYDGTFYKYYYSDLSNMNSLQLINHYITYGKSEGRVGGIDPITESIIFDYKVYADCNTDLKAAFGYNSQLLKIHWLTYGISEGRVCSIIYDPNMYYELNGDLSKAFGRNYKRLFEHFLNFGVNENRTTSLIFSMPAYINMNTDIKSVFGTNYKQIYLHFKNYGIPEGRNASYVFDVRSYLSSNADLKSAFGTNYRDGFVHFINFHKSEKRKTSSTFNLIYYSTYTDLKAAFGTNYESYYVHYLNYGKKEGRKCI